MKRAVSKTSLAVASAVLMAAGAATLCLGASSYTRKGEKLQSVSMIELIANPEKFDGQRVLVQGFVRLEFEGTGLYFHEEDYQHGLRYNGVALSMTRAERDQAETCSLKYCTAIGTYHVIPSGYIGLWSGSLSDVKFVGATIGPATDRNAPKKDAP